MIKLLIADRDPKEREGLKWLVQAYPIPFDQVVLAGNIMECIGLIEREVPDVLCIELDMIPRSDWENVKKRVLHYVKKVIGMTVEATFERAMQAIELHTVDLWVKPISPDRIKRMLNRTYKQIAESHTGSDSRIQPAHARVSYQTLFLDQKSFGENRSLMLVQPEHSKCVPVLQAFLQEYPFHDQPDLFPVSDAVVCVFPRVYADEKKVFLQEGHRLLNEWSERYEDPLSLVINIHRDPLLSLHQKYRLAAKALEMRFFKGHRQVIFVDEQMDWTAIDPFLSTDEQREWLEMLNRFDKEGIKTWMHQQFLIGSPRFPTRICLGFA